MGMYNVLHSDLTCRYCQFHGEMYIEFKFGFLNMDKYRLGDELVWIGGGKAYHKGRPEGGNYVGEGYVPECPNYHRDFWGVITVVSNQIERIEVDNTRDGYITD